MKPSAFLLGIAVGTGVGALVTVGYFLVHALTVRTPATTWGEVGRPVDAPAGTRSGVGTVSGPPTADPRGGLAE